MSETRYEFKGWQIWSVTANDAHKALEELKKLHPDFQWEPIRKIQIEMPPGYTKEK